MVYGDQFNIRNDKSSVEQSRGTQQVASPLDRLGATIVDVFVVLAPLIFVVISPLKRRVVKSLIIENQAAMVMAVLTSLFVGLAIVFIYQTWMTYRYGGTLGKLFFRLRVQNIWSHKSPNLAGSALRSAMWLLDCFLFFIPHLSIFSNTKRRALHDRVADTLVVTLRPSKEPLPNWLEVSFARLAFTALVTFVAATVFFFVLEIYQQILEDQKVAVLQSSQDPLLALLGDSSGLCSEVTESLDSWPLENDQPADRLSVAMALFAAGKAGKSCLSLEVNYQLHRLGVDSPLAYLAQAFVHSEDSRLSNAYLKRVCDEDPESSSCNMSLVVNSWSDKDWELVNKSFSSISEQTPVYIKVWGIRHYAKRESFAQVLDLVDQIPPIKPLGSFVGPLRVKALWRTHSLDHARVTARTMFEHIEGEDKTNLAGWLCGEELNLGCYGARQLSCQLMDGLLKKNEVLLEQPKTALTMIRKTECGEVNDSNDPELGWAYLYSRMPIQEGRDLIEAIRSINGETPKSAQERFLRLAKNNDADPSFRHEARIRFIQNSGNLVELNPFFDDWQSHKDQDNRWVHLGKTLLSRYINLGEFDKSLEIGTLLNTYDDKDPLVHRSLIISNYKLGKKRSAWELLNKFQGSNESALPRQPASAEDFSRISNLLRKQFRGH